MRKTKAKLKLNLCSNIHFKYLLVVMQLRIAFSKSEIIFSEMIEKAFWNLMLSEVLSLKKHDSNFLQHKRKQTDLFEYGNPDVKGN